MKHSFRQTLLFAALTLPAFTQTRSVIVLPAGPPSDLVNRNATFLNPETFNPIGTPAVGNDSYAAFTLPSGTKTYVIARGAVNTVTVLSNSTTGPTFLKNLDLPAGSSDAYLTPDGRRLLVVSINEAFLTVIETANDNVLLKVPLSAPANSVVANFESTRAFTASPNGAVVSGIDLSTNTVIGALPVPSEITLVSGLGVGPNGLIYVTAVNRLFEIDPRTLQLTPAAAIVLTGSPGRPQFTPDGNKVLMNNFTPISGGSALILADLTTRTTQFTSLNGITIDRFRILSNTLAYGYAPGNQTVYNISLNPLSAAPASTAGVPTNLTFRGFGSSNEAPQNRFLYLSGGNSVYKIDIVANTLSSTQTLTNAAGVPVFNSVPSTATLANLFAINQQQFVPTGGTTLPLVVRALDANGVPISGLTIGFATSANGVTIANPNVLTNSDGYAQTSAVVPNFQTSLTIAATAGQGFTQVFTINVGFGGGGGGGTGGTGKISIFDGNGQIILSSSPTPRPMRVQILDGQGKPVPFATVTWSLLSGNGSLSQLDTIADSDGIASNASFTGPLVFGNFVSFVRSSISATTSLGTVTFSHITVPRFLDGTSTAVPAPLPAVSLVTPQNLQQFTGAIGASIKGAFQFKITSQSGLQLLQGIAGIGVEASTLPTPGSLDTVSAQTARCDGAPLSGEDGIVTCDLILGGKVGTSVLRLSVGGLQAFDFPLTVTQGPPKAITIVSGNQQSGSSGQALAKALLARIDDGFGNILNGVPVTWAIQSGSGTLFQTISTSGVGVVQDPNNPNGSISSPGLVSTNIRLGNSPGDVKVRVSVSPTIFADFTITNTLSLSNITKVSGDSQSTPVGLAFTNPLVVEVKDTNGAAAPNTPVTFTTSGGITLSSSVVNTDSTGRAQVSVTAGSNLGTYTVTAAVGSLSTTFSLTVTTLGPTITSVVNGASFLPGLSPCAVAQITGANFATGIAGTVSGQSLVGPLQTTVNGISVQIGGVSVPIFSVSNISGRETLSFQVPCEQAPGSATLTLRSGSTSVNQTVTIAPFAPGIFQTLDSAGRATAVAVKANGTYVTPSNPADRGEDLRIFVTGLGQASPFISTNTPGTGTQRVNASVIIGVNNEGITARMEDTIYAPTLIGVYIVTFRLPANVTPGTNRPFVVAVQSADGAFSFSQSATLDIR